MTKKSLIKIHNPATGSKCRLLTALVLCLMLMFSLQSQAQVQKVHGKVTDSTGVPVVGASVKVIGGKSGIVTDQNGEFSIDAKKNAELEITAVGYATQKIKNTGGMINVQLFSQTLALEDVVVVGYGTQRKTSVTGAVATVNTKLMTDRPVTNVANALQGGAPGLVITRNSGQPGKESWNINIRGLNTLGTQNSPLVIIDGVEGDINTINPNDVANISILQDASASIYGAKSGAGVILITTKNGSGSSKPRFSISNAYSVRKPYARPEMIGSGEQAQLQNVAQFNTNGQTPFSDQQLRWFNDPDTNYVWNSATKGFDYYYNYNLADIIMRNRSYQDNTNVSISGSTGKTNYLFSFGYLDQGGVYRFGPDKYKRYNVRYNSTTKFNDKISLDARLSYSYENQMQPTMDAGGSSGIMYNIYQVRSARNPIWIPGSDSTKYAWLGTISSAYPILKDGGYNGNYTHTLLGVFTLAAKEVLPGLQLRAVYSPGMVLNSNNIFNKTIPRWTVDSSLNATPANPLNQVNALEKDRAITITQDFQGLVDYNWNINHVHNFQALAGFEYRNYRYDWDKAMQQGLLLNDFPTLNYSTLPNAATTNVGDNIQVNTYVSEFGRLTYNYKEKYFLEGIVRNDGTSRVAPNKRSKVFYGVSGGWRLSQENWFKNVAQWFNEFKLRASYGTNGLVQNSNQNLNNYDYQPSLNVGYYPFNDSRTAYIYQNQLPSVDKAWEVISTLNFGLDASVLNRRLAFTFDYYVKRNNNIFTQVQLPSVLGVNPGSANLAGIRVNGWGFSINWNDRFKNGSYFISANLSDNKNVVTKYNGSYTYQGGINSYIPGYAANSIFGYKTNGYFNTQDQLNGAAVVNSNVGLGDLRYVDVNNDGKINTGTGTKQDHGDLVYLGNTNPRYTFGVNMGVNWKGFDVSIFLQGVGKRTMYLDPSLASPFYNGWQLPWKIDEDYWTPQHTNALFPKLRVSDHTINTQPSDKWIQSGSYIRLKNLQVGYTFNKKQLGGKFFESMHIYFSGQDMWEKTGMWFKYFDPENTDNIGFQYPLWRNYAFGIDLNF